LALMTPLMCCSCFKSWVDETINFMYVQIAVEAKLRIFRPKFGTVYQRLSRPNFRLFETGSGPYFEVMYCLAMRVGSKQFDFSCFELPTANSKLFT